MEIKVYFDYVCPFCYLQREVVRQIQATYDVELQYVPYELRREPTPKVDPMNDKMRLERFENTIQPEATRLGIEMKLPWISPHPYSTNALLGFMYASSKNKEKEYSQKIYHEFYVNEKDIGSIEIIKEIMDTIGLDSIKFDSIIENKVYDKELEKLFLNKKELNISGIPTMEINGNRYSGYHDFKQLEAIIIDNYTQAMQGMTCGVDGCE